MDILALLEAKGLTPIHSSGAEYKMQCLNQGAHSDGFDTNPSMYVNIEKKGLFCQTCGFRMNEVALLKWLIGDELDDIQLATMTLKGALKRLEMSVESFLGPAEEFTLLPPSTPWDRDFRGIAKEFYTELGARYCTVGRYTNRIIFPIYVNHRLRGFDSRALGDEKPKYLRSKGFDSLNEGLYPFDYVMDLQPRYVILCEGIIDAINANEKGFPTLCIFGTAAFSMMKLALLLSTGATEVIMFLDNDDAGQKATTRIVEMIRDWITVSVADSTLLVDGKDLGDLTEEEIKYCVDNRKRA